VTERAAPPPLFGLAPCGVYHAPGVTTRAVRSCFNPRANGAAPFHPYPSVDGRYIFCGTFRIGGVRPSIGDPPPTLAVSEHTALRSSDFPLPRPCLPAETGARARQRSPGLLAQIHDSLVISMGSNQSWPRFGSCSRKRALSTSRASRLWAWSRSNWEQINCLWRPSRHHE